jgi:hypothetical protein
MIFPVLFLQKSTRIYIFPIIAEKLKNYIAIEYKPVLYKKKIDWQAGWQEVPDHEIMKNVVILKFTYKGTLRQVLIWPRTSYPPPLHTVYV